MTIRRILLVCSGNTCRSPLAEAMLRRQLQEAGLRDVEVASAGTAAWPGSPASEGSLLVGMERGLDLSSHRARALEADDVRQADLILAMSRSHLARVQQLGGTGKAHTIRDWAGDGGGDVIDPFGGSLEAYRETAATFDALLARVIDRLRSSAPSA